MLGMEPRVGCKLVRHETTVPPLAASLKLLQPLDIAVHHGAEQKGQTLGLIPSWYLLKPGTQEVLRTQQTWGQAKLLGHPQKNRFKELSSSFAYINPLEKGQAGKLVIVCVCRVCQG